MLTPLNVLMIEDSEDDALLLVRALRKSGYEFAAERVQTADEMTYALLNKPWDIILCDFHLPGFSGVDAIALVKKMNLDIPIIIVSGAIGEEMAMDCIHRGASDYIMKGNLTRLGLAVERVLKEKEMRDRQRRDEEALRQSEEKFKTIANYTVDWESWFGPDGTYLWVNPAVERITGYTAGEVLAMPDFIDVLIAEADRESFARHFREALTGTRGENFEIRCVRKDKTHFWLSVSWQPVYNEQSNFLGIRTSGRDITSVKQAEDERHRLEKQLFSAQKMEAIGSLAGGIAHDFNNILSGIMGYAELAAMQKDDAIRKKNIQQIVHSSERARNLVKQILTFSRPVEQDKKPLEIQTVVKDVMNLLRATIPKNIEMRPKLALQPVISHADYTQIHQVIMNLCTNAAQAMGEAGGLLEVALVREELFAGQAAEIQLEPGAYAKLSITDNGQGMDPAILDRIFEPFFTTKKPGEGTGLGLSVVYGIVKNHGGGVQVHSTPGRGTVFHIYLPCLNVRKAAVDLPQNDPVPGGSERILIVDDEEDLVDLMQKNLNDLGYRVTACTDSREALEIFEAHPGQFDLIITDMTMPHISGSELAQQMIRIRPTQPVILCTGYSTFINAEKAEQMGIKTFLLKPFARGELARAVRKALDERGTPRPAD